MAQITVPIIGSGTADDPYRPDTTSAKWTLVSEDTTAQTMTIETLD